jgi:hypothetical protein
MIEGSCACGAIRYRADMDIKNVVNCHCTQCRGMNGSAYSTYAALPESELQVEGEPATYAVTVDASKHFCPTCGTPIFNTNRRYPGACMLYLGTLKDAQDHKPSSNVYCESKLDWTQHLDKMPCFLQGFDSKTK